MMNKIQPLPTTQKPEKPKRKRSQKGYCGVIIITILISFIVSLIVGFASSGLGEYFWQKYIKGQEPPRLTKQIMVQEESATIEVVKKVQPSTVSIVATKDLKGIYQKYNFPFEEPFFKDFFDDFEFKFKTPGQTEKEEGEEVEVGGGTGFFVSSDGLILTNAHVVSDKTADYTVITNDKKKYDAKVLALDSTSDIAIIKIEATDTPPVELGDSDKIVVGQTVIAIGNVLGEYPNSVTRGIVSGIGRVITAGGYFGQVPERLENVIQTDAAINPGNSGAPLINIDSQVIGICTAIDLAGQLVGFAIPINDAKFAIESVKKTGKISQPYLGVRYRLVTKKIAKANNLPYEYGALVVRGENEDELAVIPGSPADKAGIVENDIILEIDGQKIDQDNDLKKAILKHKVGDEVTFKIWHKGEEVEKKVRLEESKN